MAGDVMELTIILTSYSRPYFVQRAVESVINQTSKKWRLIIQEDGSGMSVIGPLSKLAQKHHRITMREHPNVTNRREVTRYAVLINEALPSVQSPLVAYMCDNVEYKPDYVESVIDFFTENPKVFSGYVLHERDWWDEHNRRRKGKASDFGAMDYTPPDEGPIFEPLGRLDHSQVIHRLPTPCRWEEDISVLKYGDGVFFKRLVAEHGQIHPIRPGTVLSMEHLFA